MINLDKYINNTIALVFLNETYHIKEASIGTFFAISELEKDLSSENIHEKRIETALLLLNSNTEGHIFKKEDLMPVPFEGIEALIKEISIFRLEAENDPN